MSMSFWGTEKEEVYIFFIVLSQTIRLLFKSAFLIIDCIVRIYSLRE